MRQLLAILVLAGSLSGASYANSHISEASKTLCILLAIKESVPNVDGVKLVSASTEFRTQNEYGDFFNVYLVVNVLGKEATLIDNCRIESDGAVVLIR